MRTVKTTADDVGSTGSPYFGDIIIPIVESVAPERKHRTGNLLFEILRVMFKINGGSRTVILTTAMYHCRVDEAALIFGERFRVEIS